MSLSGTIALVKQNIPRTREEVKGALQKWEKTWFILGKRMGLP